MKQYQNVKFIDFYVERIKEGRFYYDPVFSRVQGKTLPDPDQGKTLPDPGPGMKAPWLIYLAIS